MSEREILFRGKRINGDEWVEGDLVRLLPAFGYNLLCFIVPSGTRITWCVGCDPEVFIDMFESISQVRPETVGQYAGLKDRNGKRIWDNPELLEK